MEITKIEIEFDGSNIKINARINCIELAFDDNIIATYYGMCFHEISRDIITLFRFMTPIEFDISLYITGLKDHLHESYDIEKLHNFRKYDLNLMETAQEGSTSDFGLVDHEMLYKVLTNDILQDAIINIYHTSKKMKKIEEIKDQECPVLKMPLTSSAIMFKKCSHYISKEAYDKLVSSNGIRKCPLCRAEHSYNEVEN
jgi:hypothetical protein